MNIFEVASRTKLRFPTPKGIFTAEDLWGLPLSTNDNTKLSLDQLAIGYNKAIKDLGEVTSFVTEAPVQANVDTQLRFDIVKHIIDVRKAENTAKLQAGRVASEREVLEQLIAQKDQENLQSLSKEQLQERLSKLK